MLKTLAVSWLAFAADASADGAAAADQPEQPALFNPLVLGVIFALFYFIMLRPKQREEQKRQQLMGDLKESDRVITIGGIHGVVTNVQREAKMVTVRIDESTGAKVKVGLSAISSVVSDEDKKDSK